MEELDYQPDFDYNDTEWQDDILSVLNEQTISENLDNETYELLKSFW
jgi:hypothetical protein